MCSKIVGSALGRELCLEIIVSAFGKNLCLKIIGSGLGREMSFVLTWGKQFKSCVRKDAQLCNSVDLQGNGCAQLC